MKKITYSLTFLVGVVFAALFMGAKVVEIRIPFDRFLIFCAYALLVAFTFTLFEELMRSVYKIFRISWLTKVIYLLAVFFFGIGFSRFICILIEGSMEFSDPVAIGFAMLSLSLTVGVIFSRFAAEIFDWLRRVR